MTTDSGGAATDHASASRCCAASARARARASASLGVELDVAAQGDEVGAGSGQRDGVGAVVDVEGDAGDFENLAPPSDQLEPARRGGGAVLDVRRDAEGDVVGALLGEGHGIVARATDIDADDVARAEDLARLAEACGDIVAPRQVHAVGAQRAGELRVRLDERGDILALRQLDERARGCSSEGGALGARRDQHGGGAGSVEQARHLLRIGARNGDDIQSRLNFLRHRHVTSSPWVNRAY